MTYVRRYVNVLALQYRQTSDGAAIANLCGHYASNGIRGLWVTTPEGGKRVNPSDWVVMESTSRFRVVPAAEFANEFEKTQ
jgi:hypothetical protein